MSLVQYKRLQQVTEGLLEKLALPEQTLSKYEALKRKILSKPAQDEPLTGEEILLQIKDGCIKVHEMFLKTVSRVIDSITDGSWMRTDDFIQDFSSLFEEHKKITRSLTVKGLKDHKESVCGHDLKWEKTFEELEQTEGIFDKFMLSLHNLQESLSMRAQAETDLADHMKLLETELSDANTVSHKVSTLVEQLAAAKSEAAKYKEHSEGLQRLAIKYSRLGISDHSGASGGDSPLSIVAEAFGKLEEENSYIRGRLVELEVANEEMLRADGRQRKYISNTVGELQSIAAAAQGKSEQIGRLEDEIRAVLGAWGRAPA